MSASTPIDWQIFEEGDWQRAVIAGELAGGEADATAGGAGSKPSSFASLTSYSLAGIVLTLLMIGMRFSLWSAHSADTMPGETGQPVTTVIQVNPHDGDFRLSTIHDEDAANKRMSVMTDYFQIEYRLRDSDTVNALAGRLDLLVRTLRHAMGLAEPASAITVEVVPRTLTTGWQWSAGRILISAPEFLEMGGESAETAMLQAMLEPLTSAVLNEALGESPVLPAWILMVDGLRQWLQNCDSASRLPLCPKPHTSTSDSFRGATQPHLADLLFAGSDWVYTSQRANRVEAAQSMIAYIVDAYGHEQLPRLLHAMREHHSWQTLAPAVFDVSAQEFERNWQAHHRTQ